MILIYILTLIIPNAYAIDSRDPEKLRFIIIVFRKKNIVVVRHEVNELKVYFIVS